MKRRLYVCVLAAVLLAPVGSGYKGGGRIDICCQNIRKEMEQ